MDRVRAIADDRDAGASELLARLLPVLSEALVAGHDAVAAVARVICAGQPAMPPLWNACGAALADARDPGRFARMRAELERSPRALVRAASRTLRDLLDSEQARRVLTLSYSGSVAAVVAEVAASLSIEVVCGEGRPRFEGRRMAETVARAGGRATLTTDAGLTAYLPRASAVIVGADAVSASTWINKAGTLGLAAAASLTGVPVFVVSGREKAWAAALSDRWSPRSGRPEEVWREAPPGIAVANHLFERIPTELATQWLTDAGPISPSDFGGVTERYAAESRELINVLP
jgi:ribose 1,5-bisphosphate isomerase